MSLFVVPPLSLPLPLPVPMPFVPAPAAALGSTSSEGIENVSATGVVDEANNSNE